MWTFASSAIAGNLGPNKTHTNQNSCSHDCSDDEASSCTSQEESLECPICWESFNIVENVPFVLWCGHTLCKNCVLGLQCAVVKFPTVPMRLPLFISCPWCNLLCFRLVYKGNLKFPRKNFFLLWMVESKNGDRPNSRSYSGGHQPLLASEHGIRRVPYVHQELLHPPSRYVNVERINLSLRKFLAFFVHLTAKLPLVIIFLLIVLYVIPATAAILALYILITVLFALPSFLMLYFAYPCLDWLIREFFT